MTTGLAFLPACGGDDSNLTGDDSSGGPTTMTMSATDPSADGTADDDGSETSQVDASATLDDSSSSADGSSSDSGNPLCGGGSCGAVAPVGWFGPVTYARVDPGGQVPGCPSDVLDAGPTVLDGFADPGPAVCSCECELSAPLACNSCLETSATQNCQNGGGYYYGGCPYNNTIVTDNCTNVDILGFLAFYSTEDNYYGGGGSTCEETSEEDIPLFQFDATIVTCRVPEDALACADGICVPPAPEGFEDKWCIYQTGNLECTDANYPNKQIFWSDVDDTRDCTNCQCGSAASSCEEVQLMVFDGEDCAGEPIAVLDSSGVCIAGTGGSIAGTGSESACPVTEAPVAIGAIAPTGPFTFCCNE